MNTRDLATTMDDFYHLVNTTPTHDAADNIMRHAGLASNTIAIEALARLLVVESTRRRFAEAKLLALEARESSATN